jgi:FAD/FMN-containing dehydrogenase
MPTTIIQDLLSVLTPEQVMTGDQLKDRYHHIWHMDQPLAAMALVLPTSTSEVSAIMKVCHAHGQTVSVFGGLTNLVGGTEVSAQDVVVSLERMNKIVEIDTDARTVTAEAGVILEHLHDAVEEAGLLFPLTYGAKGSAQVGGMLANNAGGLRVLKYGMARALTLGVEAVLADGTIITSLKKIIKDNSGYDLKQLFIGSEGTLGIITQAVLRLVEISPARCSAFVALDDYDSVVRFLKHVDAGLGGKLSGYELIWGNTYVQMTSPPARMQPPIPHGHNFYVLVESLGTDYQQDYDTLEQLVIAAVELGIVEDGAMATSDADLEWFWTIREDVHVIASQCTYDQHYDISMPVGAIGETIRDVKAQLLKLDGVDAVYPFGHIADGNMHLIVDKQDTSDTLRHQINQVVYPPLKALGGSVSAEHGVGLHKKAYLKYCRTEGEIALMRTLKAAMDPKGILNPGRIF